MKSNPEGSSQINISDVNSEINCNNNATVTTTTSHHQHNDTSNVQFGGLFLLDDHLEPPARLTSAPPPHPVAAKSAWATQEEPLLTLPPFRQDSSGLVDTDRNIVLNIPHPNQNGRPTNRCRLCLGSSTTNVSNGGMIV
jgi:hypothetical protein